MPYDIGSGLANAIGNIGNNYLNLTMRQVEQDRARKNQLEDEQRRIDQQKQYSEWEYRQKAKRAGVTNADDPNMSLDAIAMQLREIERTEKIKDIEVAGETQMRMAQQKGAYEVKDYLPPGVDWKTATDADVEFAKKKQASMSEAFDVAAKAGSDRIKASTQENAILQRILETSAPETGKPAVTYVDDTAKKNANEALKRYEEAVAAAKGDPKKIRAADLAFVQGSSTVAEGVAARQRAGAGQIEAMMPDKMDPKTLHNVAQNVKATIESDPVAWALSMGIVSDRALQQQIYLNQQAVTKAEEMGLRADQRDMSLLQMYRKDRIDAEETIMKSGVPFDWSKGSMHEQLDVARRLRMGEITTAAELQKVRQEATKALMEAGYELPTGRLKPEVAAQPMPAPALDQGVDPTTAVKKAPAAGKKDAVQTLPARRTLASDMEDTPLTLEEANRAAAVAALDAKIAKGQADYDGPNRLPDTQRAFPSYKSSIFAQTNGDLAADAQDALTTARMQVSQMRGDIESDEEYAARTRRDLRTAKNARNSDRLGGAVTAAIDFLTPSTGTREEAKAQEYLDRLINYEGDDPRSPLRYELFEEYRKWSALAGKPTYGSLAELDARLMRSEEEAPRVKWNPSAGVGLDDRLAAARASVLGR